MRTRYDANGLFATYVAQLQREHALLRERATRRQWPHHAEDRGRAGATHVWGYTYDATGRLTDVTEDGNFCSHYAYDADDNRTTYTNTSGTVNPTYDAQDRLLTYGARRYAYTANGELDEQDGSARGRRATRTTRSATCSAWRLPSGTAIAYIVDGENRRVGKQVSGTLTTGFLYKDALNVVAQLDGSGNVVATVRVREQAERARLLHERQRGRSVS